MTESTPDAVSDALRVNDFSALIAGCGYVGHRVAKQWVASGGTVSAVTRSAEKADSLRQDRIQPFLLDLASPNGWPAIPDADLVLWSVGYDRQPGSRREAVWLDGLQRLLDALPPRDRSSAPRRILYTSSTGVYGDDDGLDVDEGTPAIPDSEGGKACLAAESLLHEFADQTGAEVVILRLAGIYGPNRLLRRVAELQNRVPIVAPPDDWLNLIHVDDAVRVIDWCARQPDWGRVPGQLQSGTGRMSAKVINVVSSASVTRRTYYSALARFVSAPEPVFALPDADKEVNVPESSSPAAARETRRRSGNRRVISRFRSSLPDLFLFDNCTHGLRNAIENGV